MYLRIIIGLLAALIATSAFAADNFDSLWQRRVETQTTSWLDTFALAPLPERAALIKSAEPFDLKQFDEDVKRIERHRRRQRPASLPRCRLRAPHRGGA